MNTHPRTLNKTTLKAYIAELPRYIYQGNIHIISDENEAKQAIDTLSQYTILGVDTETRPAFRKGIKHQVALLQIASEDACYLFRLNHIGLPQALCTLLERADITKVGLSLKDDFMMLHKRAAFTPHSVIELQTYVREMGIEDMSLQKIYANIFGKRISKTARLSNWESEELTLSQQQYAATDAYACLEIYSELEKIKKAGYRIIETEQIEQHNTTDNEK